MNTHDASDRICCDAGCEDREGACPLTGLTRRAMCPCNDNQGRGQGCDIHPAAPSEGAWRIVDAILAIVLVGIVGAIIITGGSS